MKSSRLRSHGAMSELTWQIEAVPMPISEMRPGVVKGVVRTPLVLGRAQAMPSDSLVSQPSVPHILSGCRDLRVVLFGKSHKDGAWYTVGTHEMKATQLTP